MGVGVEQSPVKHRPRITVVPATALGWWAVGLAAAFFPLVFAAALVPTAAALGFVCGLAGGVTLPRAGRTSLCEASSSPTIMFSNVANSSSVSTESSIGS